MAARRWAAAGLALAVLAVVVADDALAPGRFVHHRSPVALAFAGVLAFALLAFAPRVASRGIVLGAGLAAGGALATFVSGFAWGGVPDPLTRGGIAFNLADLAMAGGDALLLAAALLHAWTNRARLSEPI